MQIRFLPDEPIDGTEGLKDTLGFDSFVDLIQTSIHNTEPPFVYGMLGDWGCGKTSVLRMLESRLNADLNDRKMPFVPIWFDAWKYENETNVVYPLLYAIKDSHRSIGIFDQSRDFKARFLKVVTTSTLALADVGLRAATKRLIDDAVSLEDLGKLLKSVEEHPSSDLEGVLSGWADNVRKLRDAFEALLKSYAAEVSLQKGCKTQDIRFVILVDDLDRCLPDTAIAILESIKNFLTVKNCIFVLALNAEIIYQGVRIKYQGLEVDGREYLEKMLNYSFYVPEPKSPLVASFATSHLEDLVLDEESRQRYQSSFTEFGAVLEECGFANPRKIKRILNRYLLFLSMFGDRFKDYNRNTVRLIVLAEYYPNIFQLFLKHPTAVQTAKAMLIKVGDLEFDIEGFESKFGVPITAMYPQLSKMGRLFDLTQPTAASPVSFAEQAEAVFNITRVI